MLAQLLRKRLEQKLDSWIAKGWVAADARNAILEDVGGATSRQAWTRQAGNIAGLLGAVLLSVGLLLFISANWQEMSRLARLILVLATMAGTISIGAWLTVSNHRKIGEAAFLAGTVAYGASIMFVGQMYHIEGDLPDGILLWLLGALLVAALLRSTTALVLAVLLLGVWEIYPLIDNSPDAPHWFFLFPWGIIMVLALHEKNRAVVNLAIMTGLIWLMFNFSPWISKHAGHEAALEFLILMPFMLFLSGLLLEMAETPTMRLLGRPLTFFGALGILLIPNLLGYAGLYIHLTVLPNEQEWTILPYLLAIMVMLLVLALRRGSISRGSAIALVLFMAWKVRLNRVIADLLPMPLFMYVFHLAAFAFMLWLIVFAYRRSDQLLKWSVITIFILYLAMLYIKPLWGISNTSFVMAAAGGLFILIAGILIMLSRKSTNGHTS